MIEICPSGEVVFYQVRLEVDEWDLEMNEIFDDRLTRNIKNPVSLIRSIINEVLLFIRLRQPQYLWFESNDERKSRIYKRVFKREIKGFPNYHYAFDDEKCHLYKLKTT